MAQIFGIIGFFISMLAIFVATEMMRRSTQRILHAETAVYKLSGRIQQLEARVLELERDAQVTPAQRKRQQETLMALEKKNRRQNEQLPATGITNTTQAEENSRYMPSQFKKTTG
ncbi:MAG: hypothetical protein KAI73_08685 [Rhodospirillaceae bacterium]|nr:hypothetical protein [Rhodospirillaceae bacterium]